MMTPLARITLALSLVAFPVAGAIAQAYPAKAIRVVVPFAPGGTSDIIGRTLGLRLSEAWKQPVIMDNRAGVAGSLGASIAAKSPPDGYTLLVGNVGPIAINNQIYTSVTLDPVKDFTPITLAVTAPQIVVVHPSVPAKTFQEFNALVRKQKGNMTYGSSGPGSISHLSAELYKRMTKTDMLHVPFKASAFITTALLSGEIDVVFSDMAVVLPHVQAGRLRALAVTGPKRTPLVPEPAYRCRIGRTGLRHDQLVGHVRAGRCASADRDAAQYGAHAHPAHRRGSEDLRHSRRGRRDEHARGARSAR